MGSSKPISPFRLSSLLRSQKDPSLAFQIFLNPQNHYRYSILSYDLIITKLGRAKMIPQMELILQQLHNDTRHRVPEPLLCHVISFYARARLPSRAVQTFLSIPSFRCTPTLKSFNSLLNALLTCRRFQTITHFASRLSEFGPPNTCTYNILIRSCFFQGRTDRALELFDEMRRTNVCPDQVTFGTLIHGLCKDSRMHQAFGMKKLMIQEFKLKPCVSVYTNLMKGVCEIGELHRAFEIKDEMERNGLRLDVVVYNTLVNALFKAGRKEEALRVLEEMKESGYHWNSVTCNVMIGEFCRQKNFQEAYRILDGVEGVKPDVFGYNVVIGWLCKVGKWSEANDLVQDMPRRKCVPDVVTYRTLFDGLCRWTQFREAAIVLDEMLFKGYVPHTKSLNEFVCGLCREGNFELLSTVLSGLASRGEFCNEGIWNVLVSVVCKQEKLAAEPFKIFKALAVS
ncbi:putative tetratricopeptide-like helical domain-containing protein [Medicago truncatula]|nr:putative pentatricopeptide repeat-containing protein At1g53330 [Medicago truncatula]XP_039685205.1 putative pentatricopeptide repeat-containing protein At1g53330 [Medicago truncatula]XP_039685206.1 putative pentatricopeptide repeat-containing protein At1g53330 [Medicago truncatula]XP_039685207.1 putative pentatricopeptide repeat-containing protein At1g53330 [Medicago truncatula]RHN40871.1 putative tetratricopeptide-like helical domain-containing protein [Medicago truncatula]